jgi:hypothetical protein
VPNFYFSAFCNHRLTASWTLAGKIGLGLLALPIEESKFHIRMSFITGSHLVVSQRPATKGIKVERLAWTREIRTATL